MFRNPFANPRQKFIGDLTPVDTIRPTPRPVPTAASSRARFDAENSRSENAWEICSFEEREVGLWEFDGPGDNELENVDDAIVDVASLKEGWDMLE